MGNHLGPFSEAPDGPEGQEQPVQAVGGQGELRGVTQPTSMLDTRSVQSPDPDTNPDRVGQYNPEHRGRGCNWPGLEFRRG